MFWAIIALFLIPQTRTPIQVAFHKALSWILKPSVIENDKRLTLSNYNWELIDINGNDYHLESAKNEVLVINFWATWCPPCIAEMESLNELHNLYKNEVVFLFISNEQSEIISKYLNKNNYNFNVYYPKTKFPLDLNIQSIPRTFIINKNGDIVIDKTGAANWSSANIKKLIDTLLKDQSVLKKAFIKDHENKESIIFNSSIKVDSSSKNLNIVCIEFFV